MAPINWYDSSKGENNGHLDQYITAGDGELETAINAIKNESNLAGWVIADEPYCAAGADNVADDLLENSRNLWYWQGYDLMDGEFDSPYDTADTTGRLRDDLYYRMKEVSLDVQNRIDTNNNHPIHNIIRHNGNYVSFYQPNWVPSEINNSLLLSHVLHDDHYTYDPNVPVYTWKESTEDAINLVINPPGYPHPYQYGFIMWIDGMRPVVNVNGSPQLFNPSEEKIRFAAYASIVYGARGIMFFDLSKSNTTSYLYSKKIAEEMKEMSPYLLTEHSSLLSSADLTSNIQNANRESQDFIVRINPNNSNEALVVFCNVSESSGAISIQFPSNWQFSTVRSIISSYGWSYVPADLAYNKLTVGVGSWWGRAFIVTKQ